MGSRNGFLHGFFSWDRLKLLEGRGQGAQNETEGEQEGARRERGSKRERREQRGGREGASEQNGHLAGE
jgi:hypothetical protein